MKTDQINFLTGLQQVQPYCKKIPGETARKFREFAGNAGLTNADACAGAIVLAVEILNEIKIAKTPVGSQVGAPKLV